MIAFKMNSKALILIAVCVGFALGALSVWVSVGRDTAVPDRGANSAVTSGSRITQSKISLPSESVLQIKPNHLNTALPGSQRLSLPTVTPPQSTLAAAFRAATDYAAVFAMAEAQPNDGEALRIKAQIYEICSHIKFGDEQINDQVAEEAKRWEDAMKIYGEKKKREHVNSDPRGDFVKSLSPNHQNFAMRVAAYDRLHPPKKTPSNDARTDPCAGLPDQKLKIAELNALYKAAEVAGDHLASLRNFRCSFKESYFEGAEKDAEKLAASMEQRAQKAKMSNEKIVKLKAFMAQAGPNQIEALLEIASATFPNGYFTIESSDGSDTKINSRLGQILRCDFGADCTSEWTRQIDTACAFQGRCAAGNIEDHMRFYALSPVQSQELEVQREALKKMFVSGDFSALKFIERKRFSADFEESTYSPSTSCF
jgi:hypothetical protein